MKAKVSTPPSQVYFHRGETMISESSSSTYNHTLSSTRQQQQQESHLDGGTTSNVALGSSPVWEVPTTNDRQPRAIWRRIFPSWKGSCQPNSNNHNSSASSASSASIVANSTIQRTIPSGAKPGSDTNTNMQDTNQTIRSDQVNIKSAAPSQMLPVLSPQPSPIESSIVGGQSIAFVSSSSTKTVATIHPPQVLPPVHRSTPSNTVNNTDTTVTITTPVVTATTPSSKLLPPQSPRIDRPPKLPPSHHQAQRSLTSSLPPPPPPPTSVVAANMIISSSQPLPQQHRPTAVTNQASQRNLSFSSTGSRHRRSSGDWPILTSLQQLSLASPQDDDQLFDAQSLTTTEPQFRSSGSNMNGIPPPPPPPPPIAMIDQPKCERRISILSDFDDDDDHLFDLSSDEDDAEDDDGSDNEACVDIDGARTKNHIAASSSPNSLTYQRSYDDSCGGNKSKDACSVSPTTVIIPPPPAPVALGDTTGTATAAVSSSSSGTHLTDTPDWMLEWAASASAVDTPLAQMKKKHDDMFTNQKDDIVSAPQEENETASCSTSTVNSCCCHDDASSTEDISMSASDKTTTSEFVYLPIEPIPKVHTSANPSTKQKAIFCAGWAIVLWNDVIENCVSSYVNDCIASNQLALPKNHNYDESIYYIELLQGGILRCTSLIGGMDDHSGSNIIEMSLCQCDSTNNSRMATSSSMWSIVPVSPTTAGACLAIRYTSFRNLPQNRKNNDGGKCYLLPVNITTRTMDRIRNYHQRSTLGKNPSIKKTPIVRKSRHTFWLQPQAVVTNESDTFDATHVVDKSDHYATSMLQNENEHAPQAQHDAVIFLRFALDAALQSSYA